MINDNKANERNLNFNDFLNSDKCHISNHSYSQISISDVEDAWNFCQAQEQKEIEELKKKVDELAASAYSLAKENESLNKKLETCQECDYDNCKGCKLFEGE